MIEFWTIPETMHSSLDNFITNIKKIKPSDSKPPRNEHVLSLERYKELEGDRSWPPMEEQRRGVLRGKTEEVLVALKQYFPQAKITGSGYYPPGGFYGWHTNSQNAGRRLYLVHAAEGGKSFFRWLENGKVKTSYDVQGWNARLFPVPSWHCVSSDTDRVSLGFKVD